MPEKGQYLAFHVEFPFEFPSRNTYMPKIVTIWFTSKSYICMYMQV